MSSCRGIIVAGVTNQARTQMAEGFLRAFTNNAVFVCSGGWKHGGVVHPLAVRAMANVGIRIDGQSSTSLEGAQRQRSTYDVYIGIDDAYTNRDSDRYQRRGDVAAVEDEEDAAAAAAAAAGGALTEATQSSSSSLYSGPTLATAMPAHWAVAQDTTDSRQSWTLWSPRDPSIYHENSIRKFQDHIYEGEPLFMRVRAADLRRGCRVRQRWEVAGVTERFAVETEAEQYARVVRARASIAPRCIDLLVELEKEYGEQMLDEAAVAAYHSAAAAAEGCERETRVTPSSSQMR